MIQWQGYDWLTNERWGQVHPDKPVSWYDPSAVSIDEDGYLRLKTKQNPKEFTINDEKVVVPIGIGLLSCTTEFGYGKFEIEAKLPDGPYLWPAFWMWSFESWPPEIDVFEGYTNKRSSYFNFNLELLIGRFWRVASNIHLGKTPDNYNLRAKNHWLGFKSPSKKFNKYGVIWQEDKIEIFFNDRCVRRITDEKSLHQFRGHKMNVIINNGIQTEHIDTDKPESEMIVKWFKYSSL